MINEQTWGSVQEAYCLLFCWHKEMEKDQSVEFSQRVVDDSLLIAVQCCWLKEAAVHEWLQLLWMFCTVWQPLFTTQTVKNTYSILSSSTLFLISSLFKLCGLARISIFLRFWIWACVYLFTWPKIYICNLLHWYCVAAGINRHDAILSVYTFVAHGAQQPLSIPNH